MKIEQAKSQLKEFLGEKILTFSIRRFEDGEWIAECNEIPAIMTGGMGDDIAYMDKMMRDAILTAAGIDVDYADKLLKFVQYNPQMKGTKVLSSDSVRFSRNREAEYAVC